MRPATLLSACILFFTASLSAQNVGIGTTSPAAKLDVNGAVNSAATGGYYVGGSSSPMNVELIRNIPNTVGNEVDLGNFTITNGAHIIRVSVAIANSGFSEAQTYEIPAAYAGATATWFQAVPVTNTGNYGGNDFALDVNISTNTISLRLRRTAGTTDGSTANGTGARVRIESVGASTDAFVSASGTTAVTAPTSSYSSATTALVVNYTGFIPALASDASDFRGILATASSEYSTSYQAWEPMSGAIADWATYNVHTNYWIQVEFPGTTGVAVNAIGMRGRSSNEVPASETIQASKDGSTWITLSTATTTLTYSSGIFLFSFVNNTPYIYYRITFPTSNAGATNSGLSFLQFYRF